MKMLNTYETMTVTQHNQFKDTANKLLANTFLCRDKKDNKESYYFLMSYKELFDEFFKILGYEILLDTATGSVMLEGASASNTLKLKRDESIILLIVRLLYHEKAKDTSLNDNIICTVADIHTKYDYLQIKRKLNKTDLISAIRLLRKYNLIEVTGDITSSACRIVILPTILMAIKSEDVNEVHQAIMRISQEEGDK
ncbi:MAG: DUF4194 domain-containing protein [Anaeroplasmataceae bacterium]|nr:DUF4194 domain-containing protein [Anaeroplasmataceae bacterium]MDE5867470.1 DUF4194 domain-containing protein [Anaeroplasmataceae bacterium]